MKAKKILLWVLAFALTLGAAKYQRMTGPTYPKKEKITLNNTEYNLEFIRSHGGDEDASITLDIDNKEVSGKLFFKNYPPVKDEDRTTVEFRHETVKENNVMIANLPHQPPAGKLMYFIELSHAGDTKTLFKEKPIVIRFKGGVPAYVLIPHIIFMFLAMLSANAAGLFAAFKLPQFKLYTSITLILILIGGMILGPIVQKYAFLEFWAGVPFGWDLTDNKLLIAFLAWITAFLFNRKKENRISTIAAALVTLIIFSIPHSMFGSELNRETGEVIQGFIQFCF
ncbi:MAG: hypothetical protein K8R54_16935 [Bacteroidales bacterium]|nr:hypothetical protein [Bacteroidales bacterium]